MGPLTRAAARRRGPPFDLLALPSELILLVARHLLADELVSPLRLGQTCLALWAKLKDVRAEAEARRIELHIGRRPSNRSWRDEWPDANLEVRMQVLRAAYSDVYGQEAIAGMDAVVSPIIHASFSPGGESSVDRKILSYASSIQWKIDQGWTRPHAELYQLVDTNLKAAIGASVQQRSQRYAASIYGLLDALRAASELTTQVPVMQPLYYNLSGAYGLISSDKAWMALQEPGACVGMRFVTYSMAQGLPASAESFPSEDGYCSVSYATHDTDEEGVTYHYEPVDSDIVCFRCGPADADGLHSMINDHETGTHVVPPLTTVTLERIDEPGCWEVRGLRLRRRLYTVRVTYRL